MWLDTGEVKVASVEDDSQGGGDAIYLSISHSERIQERRGKITLLLLRQRTKRAKEFKINGVYWPEGFWQHPCSVTLA